MHEGFTVFYADMLAYGTGLIPLESVVRQVNQDMRSFAGSTDPYIRGNVIAHWLDGEIREHSLGTQSLDDYMRDLVREADQPLTLGRVLATGGRYLSLADQTVLRQLATGTGAPPTTYAAGDLAPCVRVTLYTVPQFHIAAGYMPQPGTCRLSSG